MSGLFHFLIEQFYKNQFMTAAVVAAPMAMLTYMARSLPGRVWGLLQRALTVEIGFNSDIPDYLAVQEFVARNLVSDRFSRSYLYSSESKWDYEAGEEKVIFRGLTPGYGAHFGWWQRRPVWVTRSTEPGNNTEKFKERLSLTFMTRSRELVRDFADAVREYGQQAIDREHVSLFVNAGGWWRFASKLPNRSIATVFTSNGEAESLVRHLRDFEGQQAWYRQRGLPYHTGVLLTGTPGTGKTSLVHAVASEMGRALYYLNLGSVEGDQQLTELVSTGRNWKRSILVVEDADVTGAQVSRSVAPVLAPRSPSGANEVPAAVDAPPRKPLTLSALLNVLDGLLTPDGLIVIATSNHPELLDPALIRAGRFDLHLKLGDLDWSQFMAMAQLFGCEIDANSPQRHSYQPAPGATLRQLLIEGGVEAVLDQREAA